MNSRSILAVLGAVLGCVLVSLASVGNAADATGIPERCVEDQHSYNVAVDDVTRGTVSLPSGLGCAAGSVAALDVVVQPSRPAIVFPYGGWTYFFRAQTDQHQPTTSSFTVNAMCDSTIMCQAVISFRIPALDDGGSEADLSSQSAHSSQPPPETSTPPESSQPSEEPTTSPSIPLCSAQPHQLTYRPGALYTDYFPLDEKDSRCTYTALLLGQPSVGSIAVIEPSHPMMYAFQAPPNTPDTNVSIKYSVRCDNNGVLSTACEDSFKIYIHEEAPACQVASQAFYVRPGEQLKGTLNTGTTCADPGASLTASVFDWMGEGTLSCRGGNTLDFTYDAPAQESAATATVRVYCDSEPLCEIKTSILTMANPPPVSTQPPPTTTSSAPPSGSICDRTFNYTVATGQAIRGTLFYPKEEDCPITTYNVPRSTTEIAGDIDVNIVGDFYYKAPAAQGVEVVAVDVNCVTTFVCRTYLYFTSYQPLPEESTSAVPKPTAPALPPCANAYTYNTAPGVPLSSSLNGRPNQDACAYGRYFSLSAPPQRGSLEMMPIGDFLYTPTRQQGTDEFAFTQFCLGEPYCRGTAYIIVSNEWTLAPSTTAPTSSKPPAVITNPQITCRGSCVDKAWKTYPSKPMWDNTQGAGSVRQDGHPVDGIQVTWGDSSLIFTVYSLIGIVGVRFPTFEPLVSASGTYFEPQDFKGKISAMSPGFEMSCLAKQSRAGMGEDVWKWTEVGYGTGKGTVGAYYDYGESWYQKFGGKHEHCDVFADPCKYAPLLTPANSSASEGMWTIDVDNCDATWTGTFPYVSLESLVRADGQPVWDFIADRTIRGTLISEAVRPRNWINPGRFDALYTEHPIIISLNQFVVVHKLATVDASPISVDAEFYTYVDDNGDEAFGVNMLVYPSVTSNMTSSYAVDRHVKGFKWLRQSWSGPTPQQCPTCTGSKLTCAAEGQYTTATFTGEFPPGDCPAGTGRIELSKGPQMTVADCEANPMFVYNRSGFSATRNCKTAYQNITFRGVARGSRSLTTTQKRAFNFEGNLTLQLLMDDDTRKTIELDLSMYVARLAQDTETAAGGLAVCRSGDYWPILDPLGTSLPDTPFELAVANPEPLCVDDLSTSYGPSDWALFTLNLPNTKPSHVTVRDIYVNYNGKSVYLLYKNPATGTAAIPPASLGAWWQYTQPFLAFRDLSARALNGTITVSDAMSSSHVNDNAAYAFIFVPGAIGMDTNVEVVVNAVIETENGTATTTFRRMLHVDPVLTQLSRQGPVQVLRKDTVDNSKSDLYAIGASTGVAVAVVAVAIFYMVADNNRPLPKWVPRGKLVKDTVLSVLPAGLRKKKSKKPKRVVHRDMYDAMNSGKY